MLDFAGFSRIFPMLDSGSWQLGTLRLIGKTPCLAVTVGRCCLPALAWMQYQWLGQIDTAERERMQRTLRTAAAQFATEFDTELSRTLVSLQVDGADGSRPELDRLRAALFGVGDNSARRAAPGARCVVVDTLPGTELPRADRRAARSLQQVEAATGAASTRWRGLTICRRCATRSQTHSSRPPATTRWAVGTHGRDAPPWATTARLISPVTLVEMPRARAPGERFIPDVHGPRLHHGRRLRSTAIVRAHACRRCRPALSRSAKSTTASRW